MTTLEFAEELPASATIGLQHFHDVDPELRQAGGGQRGTVLIVDDDATVRMTFSALLSQDGYRIVATASADEARARLAEIQPDVILCDLVMNGTNGDQFCSWLKLHETWRFVPVIAITRIDHPVALAGILDAGADDVIVKPVGGSELRAHVAAALRTRGRYMDLMRNSFR